MSLKATKLTIRDVLGIEDISISPGKITVISGRNASGKTTILSALDNVLGGGNLANLSRIKPESDPEVVLVLEGEDNKYIVKKNEKGVKVKKRVGTSEAYDKVEKPQGWLGGLFDKLLSNPLDFVREKNEKKRISWMLDALDVQIDRDEIKRRLALPIDIPFPDVPDGLHPLKELAFIRKAVFTERTGVNRDTDAKFKACEQLRRSTPADLKPDHEEEISKLAEKTSAEENRITAGMVEVKSQASSYAAKTRANDENKRRELWNEHDKRKAAMMAEVERQIGVDEEETRYKELGIVSKTNDVLKETNDTKSAKMDTLFDDQKALGIQISKLETMRMQLEHVIKARTLHDQSNQYEQEGRELKELSVVLTDSIDALDQYSRELADDLPIKGLSVDNDAIKIDGVPLSQINTARQIDIAVQLACLRSVGKVFRIIWVDGVNELDSENFDQLCSSIEAQDGVYAFVSKVTDGKLRTETPAEMKAREKLEADQKAAAYVQEPLKIEAK